MATGTQRPARLIGVTHDISIGAKIFVIKRGMLSIERAVFDSDPLITARLRPRFVGVTKSVKPPLRRSATQTLVTHVLRTRSAADNECVTHHSIAGDRNGSTIDQEKVVASRTHRKGNKVFRTWQSGELRFDFRPACFLLRIIEIGRRRRSVKPNQHETAAEFGDLAGSLKIAGATQGHQ